ncbi:hypothetical protein J6590_062761 [Homalodisca vitripennis]|nr:hypothetical protein J6590_062761 [Homalodisca vitripennis]
MWRPIAMHKSLKDLLRTPEAHHEADQPTTVSAVLQTAENNRSGPLGEIRHPCPNYQRRRTAPLLLQDNQRAGVQQFPPARHTFYRADRKEWNTVACDQELRNYATTPAIVAFKNPDSPTAGGIVEIVQAECYVTHTYSYTCTRRRPRPRCQNILVIWCQHVYHPPPTQCLACLSLIRANVITVPLLDRCVTVTHVIGRTPVRTDLHIEKAAKNPSNRFLRQTASEINSTQLCGTGNKDFPHGTLEPKPSRLRRVFELSDCAWQVNPHLPHGKRMDKYCRYPRKPKSSRLRRVFELSDCAWQVNPHLPHGKRMDKYCRYPR